MNPEQKFLGLTDSERLLGPIGIFQLVLILIGIAGGTYLALPFFLDLVGSDSAESFSVEARSPAAAVAGFLFFIIGLGMAVKERRLLKASLVNVVGLFLLK